MENLNQNLSEHELSVLKTGINIFNIPLVKLKIKELVDEIEYDIDQSLEMTRKIWIKDLITKIIEMNNIPEKIKNDLPMIIRQLANRLFVWLKYTFTKLEDSAADTYPGINDYIDHLKWTNFGLIDEVETFKSIYHNTPGSKSINMDLIFKESCEFCLYDIITDIWTNYNEDDKVHLSFRLEKIIKAEKKNYFNLINYWQHELTKDLPFNHKLYGLYRIYDINNKFTNNFIMFDHVITSGNEISIKFFYQKMNQEEKNQVLLPTITWILDNKLLKYKNLSKCQVNFTQNYQDNNFVCVFIYFWQEISEAMRLTFLKIYKITILNILFYNCPSNFLLNLKICWRFFNQIDYRELFESIIKLVIDEYEDIGVIKYTNLWVIGEIWKTSPEKLKESLVNIIFKSSIRKILKFQQICLVASVINDPKIELIRHNIVSYFDENYFTFIINEKYDILDLFVEHVCQSENEKSVIKKKVLKNCYSIFKWFLVYKTIGAAERYLNWKYGSNDHGKIVYKNDFKKNIDFLLTIIDICSNEDAEDEQLATKLHLFFKWFEITRRDIVNLKDRLLFSPDLKIKLENIKPKNVNELWRVCDSFIWKQQSIVKPCLNRRLSFSLHS